MSRFFTAAGLGVLLLLAACNSSDDGSPLSPGNNSDENFQFVSEEVVGDRSFQGVELGINLSSALVDSIPSGSPSRRWLGARPAFEDGEVVILSYSYSLQGSWHVFQVGGFVAVSNPVDTFTLEAVDSIQLIADGSPIIYPDSTMDGFDCRLSFDVWSPTTSDSISGYHDLEMRTLDLTTLGLNADVAENIRFQHSDSAMTCDVSVANSFVATDVEIDFAGDGCPLNGDIVLTSAISIDCQGLGSDFTASVDGVWSIHATYDGVNESYTVSNGSTIWTYTEPCGPAAISLGW